MRLVFILSCVAAAIAARAAELAPGALPNVSGMAKLAENAYLVVSDTKVKDCPDKEGPRIGLLTFPNPETYTYEPITVDWSTLKGGRPNDLESICTLAGTPDEFLAVESGYVGWNYARIIRLQATYADGKASIAVTGCIRFLPWLPDGSCFEDIEAAQTFTRCDETYLLLAKRGKAIRDGLTRKDSHDLLKSRIVWGKLSWEHPVFKPIDYLKIATPFKSLLVPGERRFVSDLLIHNGDLYVSSCSDPGDDGPFTSAIFKIGALRTTGQILHTLRTDQMQIIRVAGHKIEALAEPSAEGGLLLAGTDDENANGTVIPVSK